jgi:hypothetical protein
MSESWAARLSQAMDDDEADEADGAEVAAGPAQGFEPGPAAWDAGPDAVADQVIAAALLGYPTDAEAEAIIATPAAVQRLTRRWAAVPPSAALIQRAATEPALRRLLASAAPGHLNPQTEPTEITESGASAGDRSPQRLRSMLGSGFALAAADRAGVRHAEAWSGGRVIRQRLPDGSTAVTAEYTGPDPVGGDPEDTYVVSLSRPGETETPLLLLVLVPVPEAGDPTEASVPRAAQAVVGTTAALGELEISGPIPVSALTEPELAAVPDSVAWSRGPWNTAWRRAAQAAGPASPLYEAVLRGTRQA